MACYGLALGRSGVKRTEGRRNGWQYSDDTAQCDIFTFQVTTAQQKINSRQQCNTVVVPLEGGTMLVQICTFHF